MWISPTHWSIVARKSSIKDDGGWDILDAALLSSTSTWESVDLSQEWMIKKNDHWGSTGACSIFQTVTHLINSDNASQSFQIGKTVQDLDWLINTGHKQRAWVAWMMYSSQAWVRWLLQDLWIPTHLWAANLMNLNSKLRSLLCDASRFLNVTNNYLPEAAHLPSLLWMPIGSASPKCWHSPLHLRWLLLPETKTQNKLPQGSCKTVNGTLPFVAN